MPYQWEKRKQGSSFNPDGTFVLRWTELGKVGSDIWEDPKSYSGYVWFGVPKAAIGVSDM